MKTKYIDYLLEQTDIPLEITNKKNIKINGQKTNKPQKTNQTVKIENFLDDKQYQYIVNSLKTFWSALLNKQSKSKPEVKPVKSEVKPEKVENTPSAQELADKELKGEIKNTVADQKKERLSQDQIEKLKQQQADAAKAQ